MRAATIRTTLLVASLLAAFVAGCADDELPDDELVVAASKAAPVDGEEKDGVDPASVAKPGGPKLGAIQFLVSIYEKPDHRSKKVGYLRVGTQITRGEKPASFDSCQNGFYHVLPDGYVCLDDGATVDLEHPLIKADLKLADRSKPLPFHYAFLRAVAPRYFRLPTEKQQYKNEMGLKDHLESFDKRAESWFSYDVGSNDVRILPDGIALGPPPSEPPAMNHYERFGGDPSGQVPWFFREGKRHIPNVSSYKVPSYAIITDRIKRHGGVALIDAFMGEERDFALTTDLRLIPTSKLKPGRGSTFHGIDLTEGWELPVAFVKRGNDDRGYTRFYRKTKKGFKRLSPIIPYGKPLQMTGERKRHGKWVMREIETGLWVRTRDVAVVNIDNNLPNFAAKKRKWIDVQIQQQVLVLYEGTTPIYATMVSTGRDGLGDHKTTHSTPRGTWRIREKHITHTMDSDMVGEEFELMDVPHVQYFNAGYALHAAYWHTEYGFPRSHGCVNLSPIDAYHLFQWTSPEVPEPWHQAEAGDMLGKGTLVHIHP